MTRKDISRRTFIISSATALAGGELLGNRFPALAETGMRTSDLPDLRISQVRVYNVGGSKIAGVVTNSGIEGNYTLYDAYWHPYWNNEVWLGYAQQTLRNKNALDIAKITSQWIPENRRRGQNARSSAIDNCLWDIIGKAVGLSLCTKFSVRTMKE